MEINVKIEQVLEPQTFSKRDGSQMVRNSFVGVTTNEGAYPKKIKFDVMGQELWDKMRILVGANYNISFDVESREWNGKWYTSLNAWKAISLEQTQALTQQQQVQSQQQTQVRVQAPQPQPQQPQANVGAFNQQDGDLPF